MGNCTGLEYRYYNGGWSSWNTNLCGGYAGSSNYVTWLYFKTPAVSGNYTSTSLSITIPWIRQSWAAKSGTLFIKLHEWSSTADDSSSIGTIPSSSNCDAKANWSSSDLQVHTSTFKVTRSLKANTAYYIIIGNDTNFLEIGYSSSYTSWYNINFNYTSYANGTAPTISHTDTKDYKFTISGTLGRGTNNPLTGATLYVVINDINNIDRQPDSSKAYTKSYELGTTAGGSYSQTIDVPSNAVQIIAVTYCRYTYGPTTSTGHKPWNITYECPSDPGIPALENSSYRNNRLTVKQNWTYSWTAAKAGSVNAPVTGYRLRLCKKTGDTKVLVPIEDADGKTKLNGNSTTDYILDTGSTTTSFTFDPTYYGFKAGDEVCLGIYAYADTAAGRKWNGNGTATAQRSSEFTPVENAGVVNVKVNDTWVEGQVWVKVNDKWHEAETVNVKVGDAWEESQ